MNLVSTIMILNKKNNEKFACRQLINVQAKFIETKVPGKRMVAVFFMKSGLIKPVPLERGATMNASWYVNTYLPQVFSVVSE